MEKETNIDFMLMGQMIHILVDMYRNHGERVKDIELILNSYNSEEKFWNEQREAFLKDNQNLAVELKKLDDEFELCFLDAIEEYLSNYELNHEMKSIIEFERKKLEETIDAYIDIIAGELEEKLLLIEEESHKLIENSKRRNFNEEDYEKFLEISKIINKTKDNCKLVGIDYPGIEVIDLEKKIQVKSR